MPKNNVILKTIFFGICFLCLFTTYNLSQGYLTTIFQGQGFIFIALIYFPYSFTSLISAWIGKRIGLKAVLLIGSSTYVIWTLVITTSVYPLIVTVALINGLGCSLLWVHEGIWLSYLIKSDLVSQLLVNLSTTTSSSQHLEDGYQSFDDDLTRVPNALIYESKESNESIKPRKSRDGTLNGLFFGIYNFSGIIGNIVTMILVQYYDFILILRIMSGFALLTWSLFWFIPYPSWHSWIISWNFITPPHSDSGSGSGFSEKSEKPEPEYDTALSELDSEELPRTNEDANKKVVRPAPLSKDDSFRNHSKRLAMVWKSDGRLLESDSGPPNLKNVADDVTENVAKDVVENVVENVAEDAIKCRLGRYPFLIPLMILIALLNILSYGINSAFSGLSIAPNNYDHTFVIAGFFLFNSISSAIFSISWGYLYDWLGWVFLLSVTQILLLAELVFISVNMNYEKNITLNPILNQYYVWWIIGLTAGIIDTGCNVLLNASISFTFDKQVVPYVFSWYRFIYCLSCAIFSILNYVIEPLYIIYGIIGWSLLSSTSIIIFKLRS